MKALQLEKYGEIKDSLSINEVSKPTAAMNDVVIEVKAAAVNPIDNGIIAGHFKSMFDLNLPSGVAYDVSGVVIERGDDVQNFEVGDEVYARVPQEQMGTVAEFVAVNSQAVARKAENISFEEAAGIPLAGLTALQSFEAVGLKEGDQVLIHAGSGGVGSFAIQYAKAKGAYVYTTTSTKNVEWVRELGADRVIDYKKEDYKELVKDADIVFDTLGGEYSSDAFQVLRKGGKVVSVAGPLDAETAQLFAMNDYQLPEEIAKGMAQKEADYKFVFMHPNGAHLTEIKSMMESGKIKPIVDTVYDLVDAIKAFEHLATGRAKGKIVININ